MAVPDPSHDTDIERLREQLRAVLGHVTDLRQTVNDQAAEIERLTRALDSPPSKST